MRIRQVVITGREQVELQDLELDRQNLAADELFIETEYTFISAGTELANYTAKDRNVFKPGAWCAYPWKAGYANVGLVRGVGAGVNDMRAGQRVFTYGPHASAFRYIRTRLAILVPDDIDPWTAAAARMAGVALSALVAPEPRGNPWVVVFGLGMIGNLAAQAFGIRGYRVIGVDPVAARRALAERCGVTCTIGGDVDQVQKAIEDVTEGRLAGITVEAVGHSQVIREALHATAPFGELVLLGTPRVAVEGNITEMWTEVHMRMVTVRGALEWNLPMYPDIGGRESQYSKQELIFDWIRRGKLQVAPLISHYLRPEQIQEAYEGLLNRSDLYTGVVLDWRAS